MQTVDVQQIISQEIIDAAIAAFDVPSDYSTYIDLNKMRGDPVLCWKHETQLLASDFIPRSPSSRPLERNTFKVYLARLQGFANRESYADVAYCKDTNTLVFGKFRLIADD